MVGIDRAARPPGHGVDARIIENLVQQIEAKDLSTAAHTWRVVLYVRAMLEERGVSGEELVLATHGAALHDVGKLDIPDRILQKPGRLTPEEFEVIEQHTVTGYARMVELDVQEETILDLVRSHHERLDGSGYPFHLTGEQIPRIARDFAVVDTFDALTSHRPYRHEVGEDAAERALAILIEAKGTKYDGESVELFESLYRKGALDYILHHFNDGAELPAYGTVEHEELARRVREG
jgi:HD-GYP domain-containing protein (c-di-GMP phosphodiesterase class II)